MIDLAGRSGQILVFTFIFNITGDILMVSTDADTISGIILVNKSTTSDPDLSKVRMIPWISDFRISFIENLLDIIKKLCFILWWDLDIPGTINVFR